VLGCGPVGRAAARRLLERGAAPSLYDVRSERARLTASELRSAGKEIRVEEDLEQALRRHRLLFDATPAPGFITERHITPATCVAAPGVPLGLTPGALQSIGPRVVHDPLQIGTAVMLLEALIP
jgi:pyrrolysine biosynthesis protein PylD